MEKEKNNTYVLFDDSYMGPGYFIITEHENQIIKFVKFYQMDRMGFPRYGIRAFEKGKVDEPDQEFRNITFEFEREDDLFEPILKFITNTNGEKLVSIDPSEQGKNNFNARLDNEKVILNFSKDVYGVKNATDFINIVLGDNITCQNYIELCSFLIELESISIKPPVEINIQKLLQL